MATIQINIPDSTAHAASEAGLLTPQALDRLLREAIGRRQAADRLLGVVDRVERLSVAPLSMDEIDSEVKAVRNDRRRRAGGH